MEFNFDDSMFLGERKVTKVDKLTSYNAKICSALWFETADCNSEEAQITQLKFSADNHYMEGRYQAARDKYQTLLELLPPGGMCMRRDVLESLSRCHLCLGQTEQALGVAKLLCDQATNEDHEVQGLSLLHQIYRRTDNFQDDVSVLQTLLTFHPQYYLYWLHLAEAYQALNSASTTSPVDKHLLKVFTCYLRALLLLQSSQRTSGSFIKCNHLKQVQETSEAIENLGVSTDDREKAEKTSEAIENLGVSTDDREKAEKFLSQDLRSELPLSAAECEEALKTSEISTGVTFDSRWFSWAKVPLSSPTEPSPT